MGFVGGYLGYMFIHENRRVYQDGWDVRGTVYWTLAPDRVHLQGWEKLLDAWSGEGYKIGLLIRADQTIEELIYGDIPLTLLPQPSEATNLEQTYGAPAGFKWVAWGGKGVRQNRLIFPIVVTFSVRMKIAPAGPEPQMIPVASRHLNGSFALSMPGVWAIGRPKQSDSVQDLRRIVEEGERLLRNLGEGR